MCVIRKDMKSVQDRLLTQMVSRRDAFDPSAWIRPKQLGLFFVCLLFCVLHSVSRIMLLWKPVHHIQSGENVRCRWCCVLFEMKFFSWMFLCAVCTFCSKRGRSRVWREVCMRCFSPDEVRFSVKQSPTEGTSSINKVMYFTTMMHAALST